VPSCYTQHAEVIFYVYDGYTFSQAEQSTIRTIAEAAARDAKRLLPDLPAQLIIRVNPGTKVIEEIGVGVAPTAPNVVYWMVDPRRKGGVIAVADAHLRPTLFFAFHRLARLKHVTAATHMDHVIDAGMAAAFERDFGGQIYPWAQYPADVVKWAEEIAILPTTADFNAWMSRHPDGRRWIGIRAGTYLVDRAMKISGKSSAQLVSVPTDEILRLARKN
jgi:hypothetical protein